MFAGGGSFYIAVVCEAETDPEYCRLRFSHTCSSPTSSWKNPATRTRAIDFRPNHVTLGGVPKSHTRNCGTFSGLVWRTFRTSPTSHSALLSQNIEDPVAAQVRG